MYAQVPQAFKYQTILRNASGEILANQAVSLRLSILQGSETGVAVYTETWDKTTNAFGLIVLNVGEGTSSDDFAGIEWGAELYYLKAEIDQTGGTNYTDAGSSQLLSVPYALYAGSSANSAESPWQQNGSSIYYNAGNVGIGTSSPNKKLVIKATSNNDTLMEILDKDGNPLMVITPQLTKFNIIKENASAAGTSGGFAVGRYALAKDGKSVENNNLLLVTSDSTRVYTIQETAGAAGTSGGFAVGRYALAKGDTSYNFFTNQDSTKVIIPVNNTRVGGFAVLGQDPNKDGDLENKFDISTGTTAETIDGENRVLWYPEKNAFMAGNIKITNPDNVGTNSFAAGYRNVAKGEYSQALGYKAEAKGDYSIAIGNVAKADSLSSFAFGDSAHAVRPQSYAFGRGSEASGKGSFAFGSGAPAGSSGGQNWNKAGAPQAIGDYSYAFGLGSVSEAYGSFAMGFKDTASGLFSTAMGYKTTASGYYSTAMGSETTASGFISTAMGARTTASGLYGTAMGQGTTASAWTSTAMGQGTTASAWTSTAMGNYTSASGYYSTAMGANTTASGNASTAMGTQTTASGAQSTAMGTHIKAKGASSFGIGLYTAYPPPGNIDSIMQNNTMAIMGGKVGIDTVAPDKTFVVNGDARITGDIFYGISGSNTYSKPDFVFENDYPDNFGILETEQFIIKNKHLPWLTSAKAEKDGINLTRMNFETLEAVENQQLQIISLKKENKGLEKRIECQAAEIEILKQEIEALKKLIQK